VVIAGCTELSVGLAQISDLSLPWLDPLTAVADIALDVAYGDRALQYLHAA
jgi:aspartate racemase